MKKMKAQMFLVSMIFLAGFVFFVQQILFQYNFLDLSETFHKDEYYLIKDISDIFNYTLQSSPDCQTADTNLKDLYSFLNKQVYRGYYVEIEYQLYCMGGSGEGDLGLDIKIQGTDTETTATYTFDAPHIT